MHALLGVFRPFSLLSDRLISLLDLNFRAGYTKKSRMCRGIVGDEGNVKPCLEVRDFVCVAHERRGAASSVRHI